MLTPTDRTWLIRQREMLISAAAKADIYSGALAAAWDQYTGWWRPWHSIKVRRSRKRTKALIALWEDEVFRRDAVITAWLNVHQAVIQPTSDVRLDEMYGSVALDAERFWAARRGNNPDPSTPPM